MLDKAQCPKDVLAEDWCTFLETALRRSGLLTTQADDLVFLHQTLLEHLAARHLMDDPHTGKQALRDVFHHPRRYWPSSPEVSRTVRRQHPLMYRPRSPNVGITLRVWGCRYWAPPDAEPSYVGFLLDAAHHSGLTAGARYLSRLTRGGLPACEFIVTLHRLGTVLPNDVLRRTASRLHGLARDTTFYSYNRVRAAQLLGELSDGRAADILHALACDTTLDSNDRVRAAKALGELGDPRAADLLDTLARHNGLGFDRMSAIWALTRLRDLRAATLVRALARDTTLYKDDRVRAAEALARLQDPRAADLLGPRIERYLKNLRRGRRNPS
ncbi:HEAT repeat domain-containing protein [Streptomyces sp. NPDC097610]|uniref:HEAT repeat domain-containing protein n=1 Tax=Streptomyces sp. NPDC097610 TaxID=3157227 RepID=UPI00331C04CE